MVQQKPIFQIFKKLNMAATVVIIIGKYAAKILKSIRWSKSMADIVPFLHESYLLLCNKNPYFKFSKKIEYLDVKNIKICIHPRGVI